MLKKNNKEEILDYLKTLGFIGPEHEEVLIKESWPIAFTIYHRFLIEKGKMIIEMPLSYEDKSYCLGTCTARRLMVTDIAHTETAGISTAMLEQQLSTINWNLGSQNLNISTTPEDLIYNDLLFLKVCGNQRGKEIADLLTVKYFAGTNAWSKLAYHPEASEDYRYFSFHLGGGINDLNLPRIHNLFEGRSVLWYNQDPYNLESHWMSLKGQELVKSQPIGLKALVKRLDFTHDWSDLNKARLHLSLSNGNKETVILGRDGKKVSLNADPALKTLAMYDGNGKRLDTEHFLLKADPDLLDKRQQHKKKNGRRL